MSCNLAGGFELESNCNNIKNYITAPAKRTLLVEKFGDFARTLDIQMEWILRYNNLISNNKTEYTFGICVISVMYDGGLYETYYLDDIRYEFCQRVYMCNK